eukprot:5246440-Prymnesium_polylepis.1
MHPPPLPPVPSFAMMTDENRERRVEGVQHNIHQRPRDSSRPVLLRLMGDFVCSHGRGDYTRTPVVVSTYRFQPSSPL